MRSSSPRAADARPGRSPRRRRRRARASASRALRQRASVPTGRAAAEPEAVAGHAFGMDYRGLSSATTPCVSSGSLKSAAFVETGSQRRSRALPPMDGRSSFGTEMGAWSASRADSRGGGVGAYWFAVAGSAGGVIVAAGQELAPFGVRQLSPGDVAGVAGERLWPDVPEVGAAGAVGGEQLRAVGHERR
jgi:hypothetical protein